MKALSKMQQTAVPKFIHSVGINCIQGQTNRMSMMPDSPESAGFFDAIKKTQARAAINNNR
jgi:hypothetical protein